MDKRWSWTQNYPGLRSVTQGAAEVVLVPCVLYEVARPPSAVPHLPWIPSPAPMAMIILDAASPGGPSCTTCGGRRCMTMTLHACETLSPARQSPYKDLGGAHTHIDTLSKKNAQLCMLCKISFLRRVNPAYRGASARDDCTWSRHLRTQPPDDSEGPVGIVQPPRIPVTPLRHPLKTL